MSYTYDKRRQGADTSKKQKTPSPQPSLDALRSGSAKPTSEQMGHRVDLPDAMREKMESAFGADLSAVKLYESEAVSEAGAQAVTQGSNIAFAPGMLDFSSYGGQELLGHEISHVVSQARGEVSGGSFLNDHTLEARADREGAMAAAGQRVAMPAAAMTSVSASPAAGPMQAKKKKDMTAGDKVRKMHAIKAQANLNPGKVRKRDERWYERQMDSMSPEMIGAMISQMTDASRQMQANRAGFIAEGRSEDEADARSVYSSAADDFSFYQLMAREMMMTDDERQVKSNSYESQMGALPAADYQSLQASGDLWRRGFHNDFTESAAGRALKGQADQDAAVRARDRYRMLR